MVDETQKPQEVPAGTESNSNAGVQPETPSMLDRADALRKGIEEATAKLKAENDRTEQLVARSMLSGRAEAGGRPMTKEQEVDAKVAETLKKFYRKY